MKNSCNTCRFLCTSQFTLSICLNLSPMIIFSHMWSGGSLNIYNLVPFCQVFPYFYCDRSSVYRLSRKRLSLGTNVRVCITHMQPQTHKKYSLHLSLDLSQLQIKCFLDRRYIENKVVHMKLSEAFILHHSCTHWLCLVHFQVSVESWLCSRVVFRPRSFCCSFQMWFHGFINTSAQTFHFNNDKLRFTFYFHSLVIKPVCPPICPFVKCFIHR